MKISLPFLLLTGLCLPLLADEHRLNAEQVNHFLEKRFPAALERLEHIKRHEPAGEYAEALAEAAEMVAEYHEIVREESEDQGEAFLHERRVGFHIENLVHEYHESDNPKQREKIRAHVREIVTERMEVEIRHLKEAREHLKLEMREVENELAEIAESREKFIREEMEEFFDLDHDDDDHDHDDDDDHDDHDDHDDDDDDEGGDDDDD